MEEKELLLAGKAKGRDDSRIGGVGAVTGYCAPRKALRKLDSAHLSLSFSFHKNQKICFLRSRFAVNLNTVLEIMIVCTAL